MTSYAFEPEAKRGVRDAPWTVSWDKGCGVSCRRRRSVEEVSLQTKEKGSCMHDCLTYICTACICLCWWHVPKTESILSEEESPKSFLH